jgi:hypothetical protein
MEASSVRSRRTCAWTSSPNDVGIEGVQGRGACLSRTSSSLAERRPP